MRATGLDWQKTRFLKSIDGRSPIPIKAEERGEGKGIVSPITRPGSARREEHAGDLPTGSSGSVDFQLEKQTDAVRKAQEGSKPTQTNILVKFVGSGSTQVNGPILEGPRTEAKQGEHGLRPGPMGRCDPTNRIGLDMLMEGPFVEQGPCEENRMTGQSKAEGCLVLKKLTNRNWKRSARAPKAEIQLSQQSSKFRDLQTVSTKGKQGYKGNGLSSTSKLKFHLAGKRFGLGKFKNSGPLVSKQRSPLSSSMKRWEVQFGKRKLCIGSAIESGSNKKEECLQQDKYLGLPTLVGRNKRIVFNDIMERVWKKLRSWKDNYFSFGGKEILIRAVA
ncbi:hypothetical protein LWI29_018361 [Acer saccharum]|uniref:Uncharacterized protein n=1 Tax=Acer saccharum TaxID=4024 RepID=A0AA39RDB8_ACESA|nr:hypothetical protein LWI29_018361 [Acer saccharum]